MAEVTRVLQAIEQGDSRATDRLLPLVYDELRITHFITHDSVRRLF
jgi:hypothetical protein